MNVTATKDAHLLAGLREDEQYFRLVISQNEQVEQACTDLVIWVVCTSISYATLPLFTALVGWKHSPDDPIWHAIALCLSNGRPFPYFSAICGHMPSL